MHYRYFLSWKPSRRNICIFPLVIIFCTWLVIYNLILNQNSKHVNVYTTEILSDASENEDVFDCDTIQKMEVVRNLGHGWAKSVYLGKYGDQFVALKIPRHNSTPLEKCLRGTALSRASDGYKHMYCSSQVAMRLMREVLFTQTLKHPNIIRLLGVCMRGDEIRDDPDITRHDIAVYEYAHHFRLAQALQRPWKNIIACAYQFADLLFYLENSPIGSVRCQDLKVEQFLFVNSTVKLADLDAMTSIEPRCNDRAEECDLGIQCQNGLCKGYNAKHNLKIISNMFLNKLLNLEKYPADHREEISEISSLLETLRIDAKELLMRLDNIMQGIPKLCRNF